MDAEGKNENSARVERQFARAGEGQHFAAAVFTTDAFALCTGNLSRQCFDSATEFLFFIVFDCECHGYWPP